jgi:hypothetical protein
LLQTAQCDDRNYLGCSKGHPVLQEPIDRSHDTRFACSAVWSCVRRSCSFSHDHSEALTTIRWGKGYIGSACMTRDLGRIGNGSSELIWRLPLAIPRCISLEEVSTPIPCCPGAGIYGNGQTRSRVGTGLTLRYTRLSSVHLPPFTLCLLPAGPLFTRLGSGHRQYRPHIAHCDHIYGFGCESHVGAQLLVTYSIGVGTGNLTLSENSNFQCL